MTTVQIITQKVYTVEIDTDPDDFGINEGDILDEFDVRSYDLQPDDQRIGGERVTSVRVSS